MTIFPYVASRFPVLTDEADIIPFAKLAAVVRDL